MSGRPIIYLWHGYRMQEEEEPDRWPNTDPPRYPNTWIACIQRYAGNRHNPIGSLFIQAGHINNRNRAAGGVNHIINI